MGGLTVNKFNKYLKLIPVLQSEETLQEINAVSFPHIKKEKRSSFLQQLKGIFNKTVKPRNQNLADFQTTVNNFARKLYGRR